ncbi:MAG: protein-L-isoaspartate O-methyltransferase, partial [Firmicutes bacterium]|nr:protein-L-isoaspartate O-methyltransferase [Bacillota bacterium]
TVLASKRNANITPKQFEAIQERKKKAIKRIESYLKQKFGQADPLVVRAFAEVPREYFVYHYERKTLLADRVYEDSPNPIPIKIGYASSISDYLGQAYMTQMVAPKPGEVALEIGTGSGFQAAVLSRICREVYTIEIVKPLGEAVKEIFGPLGYTNVHVRVGDGFFGWPEVKDGFDVIVVTCAARFVPPPLIQQLRPGGRMIIPVGQPWAKGSQFFYIYTKDKDGKVRSRKDMGCYFVPMTGAIERGGKAK